MTRFRERLRERFVPSKAISQQIVEKRLPCRVRATRGYFFFAAAITLDVCVRAFALDDDAPPSTETAASRSAASGDSPAVGLRVPLVDGFDPTADTVHGSR